MQTWFAGEGELVGGWLLSRCGGSRGWRGNGGGRLVTVMDEWERMARLGVESP